MNTTYILRFWALVLILSANSTLTQANNGQYQGIGKHTADPNMVSHANWLNEMSERRRTSRFFLNQSPASSGVQKGYVNVGKGNVTFTNRSLVSAGRLPITMSRVYDSSFSGAGDLGPGWHLCLAETITVKTDGQLEYLDDTASITVFTPNAAGFQKRFLDFY